MGGSFSEPVPNYLDTGGFICIVLRSYDKVRLLHAPNEVVSAIKKIICDLSRDSDVEAEQKYGTVQFRLPGSPFLLNGGKESATIGKLFAIRALEEMNTLGYDVVASSDLSRYYDQSSWFFKKSGVAERGRFPVLCIAPGSYDKLVLLRASESVVKAVREVINETWSFGLQNERKEEVGGEVLNEFKLRGNPWFGEGEESTLSRKLLINLIGRLGSMKWRFLFATNLKGGTDSLFFLYDETEGSILSPKDLAMISFNRTDRIRLLNFDSNMPQVVKTTILRFFQTEEPEERDYYGAHEFKLRGRPFATTGDESIATRQLICRLLETLRENGWNCRTSIDISRKMTDKSVLLFQRCEPATFKFACVALSDVDHLRLVNFPIQVSKTLQNTIEQNYRPGIACQSARDGQCFQIDLNGVPWTHNSSYNLHARSMITMILKDLATFGWQLAASADVSAKYVHHENGPDYPMDVHSLFFCFYGFPQEMELPRYSSPVSYSELRVSDLEEASPPTYSQAMG